MSTRRQALAALSATSLSLAGLTPRSGLAQSAYPNKTIHWIVPFPPGGPTDTYSRQLSQKFSEVIGQTVVVENVPGAGASIGMDKVARSAPDGYTIGLATTGTHAINPPLYGKRLPHDTSRDFTPITLGVRYVNVLVIDPRLGINSVRELVDHAKANPGKVTFGSAGNGSSNHLSGEALKLITGAPMEHVPYRGSAPALADVAAGNITFMFDILITAIPQAQAGRVKALAVTSDKRSPYAPDVPTMAESGVAGFSEAGSDLWFGIVGPAKIPRPILTRLHEALVTAMRSPEMRQRLSASGFELWTSSPEEFAEEFAEVIRSDRAKWTKIVQAAKAKVD